MSAETVSRALAPLSVADARIESMRLTGDEVVVELRDWRHQFWALRCTDVVLFRAYEYGGDLAEVQVHADSPAITEALSVIERHGGSGKGYPDLAAVEFRGAGFAVVPLVQVVCRQLELTRLTPEPAASAFIPGSRRS